MEEVLVDNSTIGEGRGVLNERESATKKRSLSSKSSSGSTSSKKRKRILGPPEEKESRKSETDKRIEWLHTLNRACASWNNSLVKEMLSSKLAPFFLCDDSRVTPEKVHASAATHEEGPELERKFAKINSLNNSLYVAAKGNNVQAVELLIQAGVNLEKETKGMTPLHTACHCGHAQVVERLCRAGANINRRRADGGSVLFSASKHGHLEVMKVLIKHGADPFQRKQGGVTVLHFSAQFGHHHIVEYLIDEVGMDPNERTEAGNTPLILACFQSHVRVVECLIQRGVRVMEEGHHSAWMGLHVAAQSGNINIVKAFINAPREVYTSVYASMYSVAPMFAPTPLGLHNNIDYGTDFSQVLKSWMNKRMSDSCTPLMVACRSGASAELARLLLDNGADPYAQLEDGTTPLIIAAKNGNIEHVKLLVKVLKPKNAQKQVTTNGWTALHWACKTGFTRVVDYLCNPNGGCFHPDIAAESNMTPVYVCAHHGQVKCMEILIEKYGADFSIPMTNDATPLYSACKHGELEAVKYLISKGAAVKTLNSRGCSPFQTAVNHNHLRVAQALVEATGSEVAFARGRQGWNAYHIACRAGWFEMMKWLCTLPNHEKGINALTDADGEYTPLHLAASHGHIDIVRFLAAQQGCDLNAASAKNYTPLFLAQRRNHVLVNSYLNRAQHWNKLCILSEARLPRRIRAVLREGSAGDNPFEPCGPFGDHPLAIARLQPGANLPWLPVDPETVQILELAMKPWCEENHALFPKRVRDAIFTILLLSKRLSAIPKDIWMQIIQLVASH